MEGNVVSSSTPATFSTSDKHKLYCDRWSDDLCSNITYTKPWYRAEIKKLRAEVSKLDEALKEDKQSFSTLHLNDILAKLVRKVSKEKRASFEELDIKGKLNGDGEIDIKRLEKFTGLYVHDISLEVEEEKGDVCVRRHSVHGSCRGIEFETTFLVKENIVQDDRRDASSDNLNCCLNLPQVVTLDVEIKNETSNLNMKDFLKYVQEEKQLQQFFVTLQNYAKWKRDRLKTFSHFQNRYPEIATYNPLRDDSVMTVCNQEHPGLRMNVVWKILVSQRGDVKPYFDLQSCILSEQLDNKDIFKRMRSKFLHLLKNLGIEKSIEAVLLIVAK
ncbi:centromere protein P-like [Dendronephthya gigantea]|uniref:centromere protein P-like n=1 Tax=Dendronephthya gigantea TaxID=151771 RepID=UPI00106D9305|nr:centromere protein P-like [Dendronephthya gigantea]